MAFLSFESVATTAVEKDVSDLTIPANATHAELQAVTNHCSYTMDGSTSPTQTAGMLLLTTEAPRSFTIDDIRNIKFVRGAGSDGLLSIHYFAGRDV